MKQNKTTTRDIKKQLVQMNFAQKKKSETKTFDPQLFNKFTDFMNKQSLEHFKARLSQYYGKNFPIDYKEQYRFSQQWQKSNKQEIPGNYETYFIFVGSSKFTIFLSFFVMIIYSISLWVCNIDMFFGEIRQRELQSSVLGLTMVAQLFSSLMKIFYKASLEKQEMNVKNVSLLVYQHAFGIFFLFVKLMKLDLQHTWCFFFFEFMNLYWMYLDASKIYLSFRLLNYGQLYECYFKILDLFINIVIGAHFIAIILFQSTKIGYDVTWISSLNLDSNDPFILYIYSFYFCSTTIMTVGYGDISPKNIGEMSIVAFIQMFGIIIFAYLINEIGYSLSMLRKKRQTVEKDLSSIEKLRKTYKLDPDLLNRTRSYLIHQEDIPQELSSEEETSLIMKLNEDLRKKIISQNSLSIVKSSLFFLTRWSKNFQIAVASKIQRIRFSPEEMIYQPQGKQRIYIICSGKIDVYAGKKKGCFKGTNLLKTIDSELKKDISDNCFGFTTVISRRVVQLYAIAKKYTRAYYLEKQKFIECVNESTPSIQYYHELKDRINNSFCWQAYEAPLLESTKHHYNPTRAYLIKKQINNKRKNSRTYRQRNNRSRFRGILKVYEEQYIQKIHNAIMSTEQCNFEDLFSRVVSYSDHKKSIIDINQECQQLTDDTKRNLAHYLELGKEYSNYFPKNNRTEVLKKYELEFCFIRNSKHNRQQFCQMNQELWKKILAYQKTG